MKALITTRRSFIISASSFAFAPLASAQTASLRFLVLGDWGRPDAPAQRDVACAMGRIASDTQTDFVISTGDNFYRHGVRSVDDPQWRDTFENVYDAPSLQTPWYAVLGNHDYKGSPDSEVAYSDHSTRWRMRARYWREDLTLPTSERVSLFFLDTIPLAHISQIQSLIPSESHAETQLRWLETELAACRSQWKLAVGHHPIFSSGTHRGSPAMERFVRPLLERYGVRAYFNGHDHNLEHVRAGSVDYICSGSGAAARPTHAIEGSRFAYPNPGFASCSLSAETLTLNFHDARGAQIYSAEIMRAP